MVNVQPGDSSGLLSEEDEVSARKEEETVVKRYRLEGFKKNPKILKDCKP